MSADWTGSLLLIAQQEQRCGSGRGSPEKGGRERWGSEGEGFIRNSRLLQFWRLTNPTQQAGDLGEPMFQFKSRGRKKPMSQAEAAQAAGVSLTHRRVSHFVLLLRISVCVFKCYLLQWGVLWRGEMGGQAALCPGVLRSTWAVVLPLTVPEPPHTPAAVCTQQVSKHCMGGARRFPSSHLLPRPACCVIFIPCRQQRDVSPRPWSAQRRDRRPLHLVGCPQGGASSPLSLRPPR